MTAWEYKRLSFPLAAYTMDNTLAQLGAEGWEVCGFSEGYNGYAVLLKRPRPAMPVLPPLPERQPARA